MANLKYIKQASDLYLYVSLEEFKKVVKPLRAERKLNGIYYYEGRICKAIYKHSPKIEYLIIK